MSNIKVACIALLVVVSLTTLFIRIPLPSRGYFNVGDIAVVFAGLVLGNLADKRAFWWGATAGGVGSALADILSGFGIFAPITLLAKGAEGGLCVLARSGQKTIQYVFLILGGAAMVGIYFFGEVFMPNMGLQAAMSELCLTSSKPWEGL